MPDYEFIGKTRLARGFSFPLKRSTLDAFLEDRQINTVTGVGYCGPSDDHRVLSADYRGPRPGISSFLVLWVNAVPSAIRRYVAQRIENELLAEVMDWILRLTDRSLLYDQTDHRFEIYYDHVTDGGACRLNVQLDVPCKRQLSARFRAKVRR